MKSSQSRTLRQLVRKPAPSAMAQEAQTQHAVWTVIKIKFLALGSEFNSLCVPQGWLDLVDLQVTSLSLTANGGAYLAVERLPAQQAGNAPTAAANRQALQELEPIRTEYSLSAPVTDRRCGH